MALAGVSALLAEPVWSDDFVIARPHDGKAFWRLTILEEYTRECLAIEVVRRLEAEAVLYRLTELFGARRPPDHYKNCGHSPKPAATPE
jgi:putative transposase